MNDVIFYFFYNLAHHSVFFDPIVIFLGVWFIYFVIILALLFSFFYRKSWRDLFLVGISFGTAFVLSHVLKAAFHTGRPFTVLTDIHTLFSETGYAFPSGHTMVASAIAFSVYFINKRVGYAFLVFALLIGASRIIAGVHFPGDILGGFLLGAGIAYLVAYFMKKI